MKGVTILETGSDGSLKVRATAGAAAVMRRFGAAIAPGGDWLVPAKYAGAFRALYTQRPSPPEPMTRLRRKPEPASPFAPDMASIDEALKGVAGLAVSRSGLELRLRLTKRSREAAAVLKSLPGSYWSPENGAWQVKVNSALRQGAVLGLPDRLAEAFSRPGSGRVRGLERVYALDEAPDLGVEVEVDGRMAIFEDAGKLFKLNAGHGRSSARLKGKEGSLACVFYGRFLDAPETE